MDREDKKSPPLPGGFLFVDRTSVLTYTTWRPWPCTGPASWPMKISRVSRDRASLQTVHGVGVVLHAVVQACRIAVQVLLHPDGVLRQDDGLARLRQLDLHRLVALRVARGAQDPDAAVAEQVVVAGQLEVVELTRVVQVGHHEAAGGGPALELLRPPALVQLLLLDDVDRVREHFDVAAVVQVGVRGDDDLHLVSRVAQLLSWESMTSARVWLGFRKSQLPGGPVLLAVVGAVGDRHVVARCRTRPGPSGGR